MALPPQGSSRFIRLPHFGGILLPLDKFLLVLGRELRPVDRQRDQLAKTATMACAASVLAVVLIVIVASFVGAAAGRIRTVRMLQRFD